VTTERLAVYPSKGNRRELDSRWLALLHREGLWPFLAGVPEPPSALRLAVEEFNRGEYWQCHESLERLWLPEQYPLRLFYHGLIKAAVGLLHLKRHNQHGTAVKLRDAEYTLYPFLPRFMGLDTHRLRGHIIERLELLSPSVPLPRAGEVQKGVDWEAADRLPAVQILRTTASEP